MLVRSESRRRDKKKYWNASLVYPTDLFDITFLCFHLYQKLRITLDLWLILLHSTGQDLQLPRGKGHKRTSRLKIRQRQNNNTTWVNSSNVTLDACCNSLLLKMLVIAAKTWSSFKVGPVIIRNKLNSSWYDKYPSLSLSSTWKATEKTMDYKLLVNFHYQMDVMA